MSRKQCGHGYYAGLKDAKDYIGKKKYLACISNDKHIGKLYRVIKKNEDAFTVEDLHDYLSNLILLGSRLFGLPDNKDDFDFHNMSEITEEELENQYLHLIWFSSKESCESFVLCDFEEWCKHKAEVQE